MLSFHNDQRVKDKYIARVIAHRKADEIIQGTGWNGTKGCAVGCTLESYDHNAYFIELGLPVWLAKLEDRIFEGLTFNDAIKFPEQFLKCIPLNLNGQDFENIFHQISVLRLKRLLKQQTKHYKTDKLDYQKQVIKVLKLTINYHLNPESTDSAVRLAARSAYSAARSAVRLAADSAAYSAAYSAAWAAESTTWAAESAAESAARSAYSAAESAARLAADSAAYSAARSAEYFKQSKDLIKVFKQYKRGVK